MKHEILITDTGVAGFYSGQARYRVICVGCQVLIHETTTGPGMMVSDHLNGTAAYERPLEEGGKGKSRYAEPVPSHGDLMTMESFRYDVNLGALVDYDGYGKLAIGTRMSDITIRPSNISTESRFNIAPMDVGDATHVVWFNR